MTKFRLIISILIIFIMFGSVIMVYLDSEHAYLFLMIEISMFLINYFLRRSDKQKFLDLTKIYIQDCDPERYLSEYEKYRLKVFLPKKKAMMDTITKALLYLDIGQPAESEAMLLSLVDQEEKMSDFIRFWYYKAWIYYYDEKGETKRMEVLLEQMKQILNRIPDRYRMQLAANYNFILARYFVHCGIFLDNAETIYSQVFRGPYPRYTYFVSVYYLGVIAMKQKRYEIAKSRFETVSQNARKLAIAKKSEEYLLQLSKCNLTNA